LAAWSGTDKTDHFVKSQCPVLANYSLLKLSFFGGWHAAVDALDMPLLALKKIAPVLMAVLLWQPGNASQRIW
jgi:hypothetical protein